MMENSGSFIDREQLRQDALEKNTAQTAFEGFLTKFPKRSRELHWTGNVLYGSLNLACLAENKIMKLKALVFKEGCITELRNIPEGIEVLHCPGNLLKELRQLPSTLKDLDVKSNTLEKIDLAGCKHLAKMVVSYNKLSQLPSLPESLDTLYCDHNRIGLLDLQPNIRLKILHCQENAHLRLVHIPASIVDGHYPSVLSQGLSKYSKWMKENDKEALGKYFQIKGNYEKTLRDKRRAASDTNKIELPKCIGCGKAVGMVFSIKSRSYQARCGGNPPCEWNMVIKRGQYVPRQDVIEAYRQDVQEMKEKIIQQKMVTLFRHMGEQKSSELFEQQLKAYESAKKYLDELESDHKELLDNEQKKAQIEQLQLEMNEALKLVKAAREKEEYDEAAEIQYKTILPKSQQIQRMQYEYMRMYLEKASTPPPCSILLQEQVHPEKMEMRLDV